MYNLPRFRLCSTCEAKNIHPPSHPLLKLKESKQKDVHDNIVCDGCNVTPIKGIRYKCGICRDYDLCSTCEAKNEHPIDHPLIKLKVPTSLKVSAFTEPASPPHPHPRFPPFWARRGCGRNRGERKCPMAQQKEPVEVKETKEIPVQKKPAAHFVRDVNLPDGATVLPGAILMKSWEFANPTSVTWPEGSKLIFVEGSRDLLSATEEFEVPRAAPGQTIEAKCPIQVPSKPGKYVATFQLATKDREPFEGHRCWVELVVAEEEPKPVPISIPEPKAEELSKPQTQPKTESKPVEALPIEQPKEELKIVAQKPVEEPKPVEQKLSKQDQVDQALREKYNGQLDVLESMGFTNAQLNLYLIQKHKGNVEQTVSWLLEMEKTR